MKAKIFGFGLFVAVVFVFSLVSAQVPNRINYQGKLTTPAGGLMDTVVSMQFSIYADSTTATYLWRETQGSVAVSKSVFNVILGSVTAIPDSIFDGSIRYLGIKVGDDSEMSPRKPIVSVGYAYKALDADTAKTVAIPLSLSGSSSGSIISANNSSTGEGIRGVSEYGNGVYGQTSYANSLWPTAPAGIVGTTYAPPLSGIFSYGVRGVSYAQSSGAGVFGYAWSDPIAAANLGVWGKSNSTYSGAAGVRGDGSGAEGTYGVYYSGGLAGTGTKSCIVKTSQGPALLYCQESPENWFEDFGEGQLINGKAHIELDPLFLETVTIDHQNPMKVFIQLNGDCNGVYVVKGKGDFDVMELNGGTSDVNFDYRVVAKRQGFEDKRFDKCEAGLSDPYLYPELREREKEWR